MNGRIYDPMAARFMSADPYIQAPDNLQNYNRYAYVLNSPFLYTDPTGFSFFSSLKRAVTGNFSGISGDHWKDIASPNRIILKNMSYQTGQTYVAISSTACGAWAAACAAAGSYENASVHGASFSQAAKAGAIAYVTTYASNYLKTSYGNAWSMERVLATSAVGGITAELKGGNFLDGFKTSFGFSLLTYGNYLMRQEMIEQSRLNEANANGKSRGFFNDFFKLGGARREYGPDGPLPCDAPLGGCQGAPTLANGDVAARFGPISYQPGSILDTTIESFAGPHDFFRNLTGSYTDMGNSVSITSGFGRVMDNVMNFVDLAPAAPFAVAAFIQTQAPTMIYSLENKR
jgi:hypothetical protein